MSRTAPISPRDAYSAMDWVFLAGLSLVAMIVGLRGIFHFGYIGQDFSTHRDLVLSYPGGFSYALTNPPGLYWFGSIIRDYVSRGHYLECIALALLLLNTSALWVFYGFVWGIITRWELRYAAAAFITLVPFRVIHSIVLAADAFTIPIFALVALFTWRLFLDPRNFGSWIGLSLGLVAGALFKYTFASLMPPVALLLGIALWRRLSGPGRFGWAAIGILALAVPTGVFLHEMHESTAVKGEVTNKQWLPRGAPSVMRWRDMLMLERNDAETLDAPGYFGGKLFTTRKYSYPALLHVSAVTDVFGFFQAQPAGISTEWDSRTQDSFKREPTSLSHSLQVGSVRWCLPVSALAVVGTILCIGLSLFALATGNPLLPDPAIVLTALAFAFYSVIFFSLPRLGDPYTPGFWLPRLILPALVTFYALGFVGLDLLCARQGPKRFAPRVLPPVFAAYTLVACVLFVGFLY